MPEESSQKISKIKGRPMLYWVGKQPISAVSSYPAQLIERIGKSSVVTPTYQALDTDWRNLLFHGDNKEVLSTLIVNGFRGKIDLIYIDPPFDSGADYVRKVELRGSRNKLDGEGQSILEQTQYTDIWANDNYLQFMYERLILMRELLSERGTLVLHCDWHKEHHLRMLLDEVFGADQFKNDIVWYYWNKFQMRDMGSYARNHDMLFVYAKDKNIFNPQAQVLDRPKKLKRIFWDADKGRIQNVKDDKGKVVYDEVHDEKVDDVWDMPYLGTTAGERSDYPTQKPEELLSRILASYSNENSIVLDCFIGSGTTAAVAQKMGRRWIAADINKGAIQTTAKRVQKIIQHDADTATGMLHYRVNNYDFQKQHELQSLILEKYDVTPVKTDSYFEGTVGERLVKIANLNQPVNKLVVQHILDELQHRGDETRDIVIIGSGVELGVDAMITEYNKTHAINKIEIKDIQAEGVIINEPPEAAVDITRNGNTATVTITDYISPTIIKRLDINRSIFGEKIGDFRAQIDVVLIDAHYDGHVFTVTMADVPEKKSDFVAGTYTIDLPSNSQHIAIKIIDMLGEETLVVD